jgi:hypothetical protein
MRKAQGHKEEIIVVSPNENIDNGETKSSTEETVYEPKKSGETRGSSAFYPICLVGVSIMIIILG